MRVLMMLSSIALSGGERNVVSVLPYFKKYGATPILCTLNKRRDSPLADIFARTGVPRIDLNAMRMTDPLALLRLCRLIKKYKIDILHAQDQDAIVLGALAGLITGIPFIMTRHVLKEPEDTLKEKIRAKMILSIAKYFATQIIVVSRAVRHTFAAQTGVQKSRIHMIYNGIDRKQFQTRDQRDAVRTNLGWPQGKPVVTFVGVLRRGKGHDLLLKAIPRIKKAVPDVLVKLIGSGKLEDKLKKQAEPFPHTIEFMGQRIDVPQLLGASDLLVLPSWAEALPTVLIEAGATSLPVVATDVGGTAEIIINGETGYIVPAGDVEAFANRVINLIKNRELSRRMGHAAYARVTDMFTLDQQAKATVNLYRKVWNRT